MFFDEIIHGTQYYRSPTPLPDEWEGDIARLEEFGLDTFQIRINWRWNEIREGEYRFDDVDRLVELAEKYGKKVIIKFLLECAPQYIFDKYDGTRIGPRGERLRGGSHGAFYGGWRPCFTNPKVAERAGRFVERVAERYKDRKCVILWNAWNEIRNKPIEDCFCPHCRAAFGVYLKRKFGTIERLNEFYGAAEDSFDTIALPAMPHGFWDMLEFKKFKGGDDLYGWLRIVYDAIRKHDTVRPIMSHVGFTSAFQDTLGDVCDDYTVSRAVDFFGTSIPCDTVMDTPERRLDFMMLCDYLRSICKDYFLYEIYPGLGMFKHTYDTPYDMNYKLYTALSSGAKGLVYWQYRAERVGHENDCAGLMRADGSPREVAYTVADFGKELKRNMKYLKDGYVKPAEVAIVFDFNSMLLSEMEDSCGPDFHFEQHDPLFYYRRSHAGMYRLIRESDFGVDYIGVTSPERFCEYKVLYFPYYNIYDPKITPYLEKFVREGGVIIADEGFGLRRLNTWIQPYDIECSPIMTARMRERRIIKSPEFLTVAGERVKISPYKTEYFLKDGRVDLCFDDGVAAMQTAMYGKGRVHLLGFPLGYSSYECRSAALGRLVEKILTEAGVSRDEHSNLRGGISTKRLLSDEYETIFIFNNSGKDLTSELEGEPLCIGGALTAADGKLTLPAEAMGYYSIPRKK